MQNRADSYWWDLSMRQVEVAGTMAFGPPRQARAFIEAPVADNRRQVLPCTPRSSSSAIRAFASP